MDEAIFKDVRTLLAGLMSEDESTISPTTHLERDLRADSLRLYEILMAVEDKFGLPGIPEEAARNIKTVADIVQYVEASKVSS